MKIPEYNYEVIVEPSCKTKNAREETTHSIQKKKMREKLPHK